MAMTGIARHDSAVAEINITPLVDVMLVLLVIFMLAQPLLSHRIDLPLNGKADPGAAPRVLALAIAADGTLMLAGDEIAAATLPTALRQQLARDPALALRIHADSRAAYERVAMSLAAARSAGVGHIAFEESAIDP